MGNHQKIAYAAWISSTEGVVFFHHDYAGDELPPLQLLPDHKPPKKLRRASPWYYGRLCGYFIEGHWMRFVLCPDLFPQFDFEESGVYVAGDFNGWEEAVGQDVWRMQRQEHIGMTFYVASVEAKRCNGDGEKRFKFVTGNREWLPVNTDAYNTSVDEFKNSNYHLYPHATGQNAFYFSYDGAKGIADSTKILWSGHGHEEVREIVPGRYFYQLKTNLPLGVHYEKGWTVFRLFAPRASEVKVYFDDAVEMEQPYSFDMQHVKDGVWEIWVKADLEGQYYFFTVDSEADDRYSDFDTSFHILDPYALAAVSEAGPGIIVYPSRLKKPKTKFKTPKLQDLVICECHVRDLTRHAPIEMSDDERRGFTGLTKWVNSDHFYLNDLGVNAVELQPITEFGDAYDKHPYHWGYMPVSYFSPDSSYSLNKYDATRIQEFQELVDAFHNKGMAVILDVVYNHVGEPNGLYHVDKAYYFDLDPEGELMNWSGCGNTLDCNPPMVKRLLVDSLVYLVQTFGIDGFRFDLAELIGVPALKHVEQELRKVKPDVVLIAEPWSFRGHIMHALRTTSYASWNDGYREFIRKYILGNGSRDGMKYFLGGSLPDRANWPGQSINYVESHDDYAWIDRITENANHDGSHPTPTDRRRTHLMHATLMASLGTPMIHAGMDMLHSKQGVHNTYRDGDKNAIYYPRAARYPSTQEYYRQWVLLRLSDMGRILRTADVIGPDFFRSFQDGDNAAVALMYNNDGSQGKERLIFAINPHNHDVHFHMEEIDLRSWWQLADHERCDLEGLSRPWHDSGPGYLKLPPMSCGLWFIDKL